MDVLYGVRFTGPLAPHARGMADELARLGFTDVSARCQLGLAAHLSRWLAAAGLGTAALTVSVAEAYLAARRAAGYTAYLTPKALAPLLGYLRGLGVAPEAEITASAAPAEIALERYRCYLLAERGLQARVARGYVDSVRLFVARWAGAGNADLAEPTAGEVTAFLTGQSRRLAPKTAQRLATALRSLLRFWHLRGLISGPLDQAVPCDCQPAAGSSAGGKVARPPDLKRNLLYVIIAEATNMGLGAMAESCGVPYDVLAWTAEWYFRAETLEAANAAIVNYHHRLPMTQAFGTGTLSSSDGQRFPVKGKSLTARHLSRYFARGQGISTYTHVSDQHSTFDTKVIAATDPESPYVLDGILGNQTDLLITEHATDTHGATLANFALFDLVGLQLSPRIRDLGKITLYRTGSRADFAARYPSAGYLLARRLNEELITGMWDDLLRVAASVKGGHATAALVVGKLCSSKRQQNALASAIKEYGALRRTVYAARYLADEAYRRRIGRQLNKGENLHALKRSLAYAGEGALRRRHHEQQAEQMWCLTLATNAVVTWTTEYHGLAVTTLRRAGRDIDDAVLAHIWPTHHENVNFYGTHSVDVDGELAKLGADGYRPLRVSAPAVSSDR